MTDERFQSNLTSKFKGNEITSIGSAFHELFENADKHLAYAGNFFGHHNEPAFPSPVEFERQSVLPHLEEYASRKACNEVWNTKVFDVDGDEIQMNMRIDGMYGLTIIDFKTTFKQMSSYEKFSSSAQGKIYPWAYGAEAIVFKQFKLATDQLGIHRVVDHAEYTIPVAVDKDKLLAEEIKPLIRGLVEYCENNNLINHIQQRKA
jgi:hypothetical protein